MLDRMSDSRRNRWIGFGVAGALGWFLLPSCGPLRVPMGSTKVTFYNVYYLNPSPRETVDVIEAEDPDILCLRELMPDVAAEFESRLSARYPYRDLRAEGGWGVGIASKYPILRTELYEEKPVTKPAMDATIQLGDKTIRFGCVHLTPPFEKQYEGEGFFAAMKHTRAIRREQGETIATFYDGVTDPIVIAGDFNEGTRGGSLRALAAAGFRDSCDGSDARCARTYRWKSWLPSVKRIDHVYGRGVSFAAANVGGRGGSDHYAISTWFTPASASDPGSTPPAPR